MVFPIRNSFSSKRRLMYASQAAELVRQALRSRNAGSSPSIASRYTVEYEVCKYFAASFRVMIFELPVLGKGRSFMAFSFSTWVNGSRIMHGRTDTNRDYLPRRAQISQNRIFIPFWDIACKWHYSMLIVDASCLHARVLPINSRTWLP